LQVGICTIELQLNAVNSLKGKRRIIKSVIEKIKNRYNVSVAEVDKQQNFRSAAIGLSKVSNDSSVIHRDFMSIINYIDDYSEAVIFDYNIEII